MFLKFHYKVNYDVEYFRHILRRILTNRLHEVSVNGTVRTASLALILCYIRAVRLNLQA